MPEDDKRERHYIAFDPANGNDQSSVIKCRSLPDGTIIIDDAVSFDNEKKKPIITKREKETVMGSWTDESLRFTDYRAMQWDEVMYAYGASQIDHVAKTNGQTHRMVKSCDTWIYAGPQETKSDYAKE